MRRSVAAWTLAAHATAATLAAQSSPIHDAANAFREAVAAPGAIVGVRLADGTTHLAAVGSADLERALPMRVDLPFYLGSISKTYTAAMVLRLVEQDRLSLDDRLSRWFPDFPRGAEVSVRQLLEHTSGLRDFYGWFYYRPERAEMIDLVTRRWTEPELVALSSRFGYSFDPGTSWDYSSTNYYLLGVIAERVTGLSLADAYRLILYEPLHLSDTWLPKLEPHGGTLPTGYMGPVKGWRHSDMFGSLGPTTVLDTSTAERSAGGLAATAVDALEFLAALMEGRILGAPTLARMMPSIPIAALGNFDAPAPPEKTDAYGQGLARMRLGGHELIGHGGLYNGHSAGLWYLPDCRLAVVVYANRGLVNMRSAIEALVRRVAAIGSCQ